MAHILVADDDPSILKLMAAVLSQSGHTVTACATGLEAVKTLGIRPGGDDDPELPDLIVLDIMMPKLDGYSLGRMIREHPRTRRVPLIVISALPDISQLFTSTVQVEGFLHKPFSPEELTRSVSRALDQSRA